jgi:hypothetical protein
MWIAIHFDGAKSHVCRPDVADAIIADLATRGHRVTDRREIDEAGADLGGVSFVSRPFETFLVGGDPFHVASDVVCDLLCTWRDAPVREGDGVRYVKLHSHWNAAVISPDEHAALIAAMQACAEDAWQRGDRAWREQIASYHPSTPSSAAPSGKE